jgi:ribose transport system ATP-binding protein
MNMQEAILLEMKGICKAFPGVQALDHVDLEVRKGEVMALVGENGAGKSTLMKILAGTYTLDEGTIILGGEQVHIKNPKHARDLGISVIYQELNLAEHISVAENIFAGREFKTKLGLIDYSKLYKEAQKWLDTLHITGVRPRDEVRNLSIAKKQMVEIAKAIALDSNIIVMDEPTSSLPTATTKATDLNEVQILLDMVDKLRKRGKSIIYISHRLEEIFTISDRITVMRDSRLIGVKNTNEANPDEIISMMVGRDLKDIYGTASNRTIGDVVLKVEGINQGRRLHNISLDVRAGEVLGVAGLVGAGRTETARAIFGAEPTDSGVVYVHGKKVDISSPADAIKAGIGYLPEDRKKCGLFLKMAVKLNVTAANLKSVSKNGFLQSAEEEKISQEFVKSLKIRTPSINQLSKNLSGGNQQKVVIAKWLTLKPKVLIVDEPTRGIDVGAKIEIYNLIHQMTEQGVAIVMISSELPEILGMSDRVVVLREGHLAGELNRENATEEKIMMLATGVASEVQ